MMALPDHVLRAAQAGRDESLPAEEPDLPLPEPEQWPVEIDRAAYQGLAGEIVHKIAPETEADPVAVLVQFLVMFGNCVGRNAYWRVEEDWHFPNLFACLVGDTAIGRKGTSKGRSLAPFAITDNAWKDNNIIGGMSSGEGLIDQVRDEVRDADGDLVRDGVKDKRLLVIETEFASPLRMMRREGNILDVIVRQAWDGQVLGTMTKNNKLRASKAHVSILGHVTRKEVLATMTDVAAHNGFANRFLWIAVRRSKLLPLGGKPVDFDPYRDDLVAAVEWGQGVRIGLSGLPHTIGLWEVPLSKAAEQAWNPEIYKRLNGHQGVRNPEVISRGAAQVRRLAMIYALLARSGEVRIEHLNAAVAVWDYSVRSVRWVFGDSTGNKLADEILQALNSADKMGMTSTEISDYLGRHQSKSDIGKAMQHLLQAGTAWFEETPTRGRPTKRWYATAKKPQASEGDDSGEVAN